MRFVKEKSSVIMIGDSPAEKRAGGELFTFLSLNPDQFTYNDAAKKNIRLHSRKAKLLLECLHLLDFENFKTNFSSREIGVYLNAHQNILDFDLPDLGEKTEESIYQHYKRVLAPTYNVKNITGILPGHICIYHEINGPSFALTSMPATQVFLKAMMDLKMGLVKCAVVGIANTYEDPLVLKTHTRLAGNKILNEAAGVFLLTRESAFSIKQPQPEHFYGFLEGLINTEKQ